MRKRFSDIKKLKLFTADDNGLHSIGQVTDLLIEDGSWNVRYLVVQTDAPLSRRVLISPSAIHGFDFANQAVATILSAQQLAESPRLDEHQPVSRQYEQALVDYYGWPIYWFGRVVMKPQTFDSLAADTATAEVNELDDTNLRSAAEICRYSIESQNGPAGVMEDMVVQMEAWTVDYATANSGSWLATESSMFSTSWIGEVDWSTRKIKVDLRLQVLQPTAEDHEVPAITGEPWSAQPFRIS